jgi:hypothetical protein
MRWGPVILAAAVVSGCGERAYIDYQGREALTALECQAGYEAAKDRGSNTTVVVPNNGAGLAAIILASGIVSGNIEAAYERCLSRVATLPPGTQPASGTAPLQSTGGALPAAVRPSGCAAGASPFQGGTGYCVGR